MKLSCNQKEIIKSLNIVSKAVTSRTTIPILKGILIEADKDNQLLTLSASDLDISIETVMDATVIEEGSIIINAKLLNEIMRKVPSGEIIIELEDEKNLIIKSGNSRFNVVGMYSDEFPKITEIESDNRIILEKNILKNMIKETCFAASIDESRGILVGALMELKKDSLNMVALDGYRMAVVRRNISSEKEQNIIISAGILLEIAKIFSENEKDEDVEIIIDEKKSIFNISKTKIATRLIDGDFINYRKILTTEKSIDIIVNKNDLLDSIERAAIMIKDSSNSYIKLNIESDKIYISSQSEEGSNKEEVKADINGENLEIGFNSKLLIDNLKVINDEDIRLELSTKVSPCIIKPIEGDAFEYLVLPVRID